MVFLEEALQGSGGLEDPSRYAKVYYWMGNTFGNLGRYDDAREHLNRSLELSQTSESMETEGNAHNYMSQLDYMQSYLKRALDHAEAAVQCLREIGNPTRLGWALIFKGMILSDLKREADIREVMEEAKASVERSGNDRGLSLLLLLNCLILLKTGQYEAAQKSALEGLEMAERMGEGILTVFFLAYAGPGSTICRQKQFCHGTPSKGRSRR